MRRGVWDATNRPILAAQVQSQEGETLPNPECRLIA